MESDRMESLANELPGTSTSYPLVKVLDPELILSAVKKARQARQPRLREQLHQLRDDIEQSLKYTRNPLQLFPEELWLMIRKSLQDFKDMVNCPHCNVDIFGVMSSPQELLFCKILPHLIPYFGKHPASTIVVCGKVCRSWRHAVDRLADHFYRVQTPPYRGIESLTKDPVPRFPDKNMLKDDTRDTDKRQFLSEFEVAYFRLANNRFRVRCNIRHCLWKVSLQPYSSSHSFFIVKRIIQWKNLKCIRLLEPKDLQENNAVENNGVNRRRKFEVPSNLESLEVVVKSSGILPVQDALLRNLNKQLKRLEVVHWNFKLYHRFQWTNLMELEILDQVSLQVLDSLRRTTAPKLWKLHIHWNTNLKFEQLIEIVNQFGNLRHLSILLTGEVAEEDLAVPCGITTLNNLTTLEIVSQYLNHGMNISLLFPMVENLVFHYNWNASISEEFDSQDKSKRYIQIYINMYYSNVWTMFPKLDTLTFNYKANISINQAKFTRLGYLWEKEKHAQAFQSHVRRIQEKQNQMERTKLKLEQYRMKIAVRKPKFAIQSQVPIQLLIIAEMNINRSFPLIMLFLRREDLLLCRLVCKNWKTSVGESILENSIRNLPLTFNAPLSTHQQLQNFVSFVEDNTRTPFFARTVEINIKEEDGCVDGIEMMLADLGKYIRHLTISTEVALNLINVHKICVECMGQCPNLKSFSLNIPFVYNNTITIFNLLKSSQTIVEPAHLESFSFYGESFWNSEAGLFALRRHLEETFSDLITTLVVERVTGCSKLMLKELTVTNFETDSMLHVAVCWYGGKSCPGLRKLRLCINQLEVSSRNLCDIILFCKELEFLELQFTIACLGYDKNLMYWDPFVSKSVTEFQIVLKNKYQICLDFLVHFPCIQTLRIIYGRHAVLLNEERYAESEVEAEYNLPVRVLRSPENDFIQLVKFLKDDNVADHDAKGIHASNIWSVLPRLKRLEIVYCAKKHKRDQNVFYRMS